jgi:hypothetical protein
MSAFVWSRPNRRVTRVFLHCSAASRDSVSAAEIDRWHRARGFKQIGYHAFIRTDGTVEAGRPLEEVPAAQAGHNLGTVAICLNGLKPSDFTAGQFLALRALCRSINDSYHGRVTFHGHREVANKTCPVFDYRAVLGLDKAGRMAVEGAPSGGVLGIFSGMRPRTVDLARILATHRGDPKSQLASRGVIGALVVIAATVLRQWGVEIDTAATTELVFNAVTLAGGVLAYWGRLRATRPIRAIRRLPVAPPGDDPDPQPAPRPAPPSRPGGP